MNNFRLDFSQEKLYSFFTVKKKRKDMENNKNKLLEELNICTLSLVFWRLELEKKSTAFHIAAKNHTITEGKKREILKDLDYLMNKINYEDKVLNKIEEKYKNLL